MFIQFSIEKNLIYIPIFIFVNFIYYYSQYELNLPNECKLLIRFSAEICLIIFYFIQKYLSRIESKSKNENLFVSSQNENNEIKIFIIMIIFNLIYYYVKDIKINNNDIEHYIYIIMFLFLIDLFILQNNIYSHQILSIILLIIGIIYYMIKYFSFKLLYLIYFMSLYCRSFGQTLIRYISINYFINIYLISSSLGFIGLIHLIITRIIKYDNFIQFPNSINYILILYILSNICRSFLYYRIIYKLGTIHVYLSDLISYIILNKLFHLIYEKRPLNNSLDYIIIPIILISMLIYFEIIQLNFCGLNENTKNQLLERSDNDIKNINESINDDNSENEI